MTTTFLREKSRLELTPRCFAGGFFRAARFAILAALPCFAAGTASASFTFGWAGTLMNLNSPNGPCPSQFLVGGDVITGFVQSYCANRSGYEKYCRHCLNLEPGQTARIHFNLTTRKGGSWLHLSVLAYQDWYYLGSSYVPEGTRQLLQSPSTKYWMGNLSASSSSSSGMNRSSTGQLLTDADHFTITISCTDKSNNGFNDIYTYKISDGYYERTIYGYIDGSGTMTCGVVLFTTADYGGISDHDYSISYAIDGSLYWTDQGDPGSGGGVTNDSFAKAKEISGLSGSTAGSNVGATTESGEPLLKYRSQVGKTVWWKWTAPSSGRASFSTVGSSFDTVMGVYEGSYLGSLSAVCEDDDGGGNRTSSCAFDCRGNNTYYIAIGGYDSESGTVKLNWSVSTTPAVTLRSISIESGVTFPDHYLATGLFGATQEKYACMGETLDGSLLLQKESDVTWSLAGGAGFATVDAAGVVSTVAVTAPQKMTLKASCGGLTAQLGITLWPPAASVFTIKGDTVMAYTGCEQDVVLPEGVAYAGHLISGAFSGMTLRSITLPTTFAKNGFGWHGLSCARVDRIIVREGNPNLKVVDGCLLSTDGTVLYACETRDYLRVPDGVTELSQGAFRNCRFKSVDLPESLTFVNTFAFDGCGELTSLTFPARISNLSTLSFLNCTNLATVSFEGPPPAAWRGSVPSRTLLRYNVAYEKQWKDVVSSFAAHSEPYVPAVFVGLDIEGPNDVQGIRTAVFVCKARYSDGSAKVLPATWSIASGGRFATIDDSGTLSVFELAVPADVTVRADFDGMAVDKTIRVYPDVSDEFDCDGTRIVRYVGGGGDVAIPSWVTSIGSRAFENCLSVTSVSFPEGLAEMGECVFQGCRSLSSFEFLGAPPSGLADSGLEKTAVLRYHEEFEDEWNVAVSACGFTNASVWAPPPVPVELKIDCPDELASPTTVVFQCLIRMSDGSERRTYPAVSCDAGGVLGVISHTFGCDFELLCHDVFPHEVNITATTEVGGSILTAMKTVTILPFGEGTRLTTDTVLTADSEIPTYPIVVDGCRVTVESGCFRAAETIFRVAHGGELVINGGTIQRDRVGNSPSSGFGVDSAILLDGGSRLTVNGGTIRTTDEELVFTTAVRCQASSVEINGGTLEVPRGYGIMLMGGSSVCMNGGFISCTNVAVGVSRSSATFAGGVVMSCYTGIDAYESDVIVPDGSLFACKAIWPTAEFVSFSKGERPDAVLDIRGGRFDGIADPLQGISLRDGYQLVPLSEDAQAVLRTGGAFSSSSANAYDGYVVDDDCNLVGVVQVKTAKQTVKKGAVTIAATATVTDLSGKKWSYSGGKVEVVPVPVTAEGRETSTVRDVAIVKGLKCTAKGCSVTEFGVTLGLDGMQGEFGGYAVFGARNGMGTKGDSMMAGLEAYKGKWSVTLGTLRLQMDVQTKGVVKIAGNWENGAKVSASAQLIMSDGFAYVPVMVKSTKTSPAVNALLKIDPNAADMPPRQAVTRVGGGELLAGGRTTSALEILDYLAENPVKAGLAYVGRVALNELAYPAKFTQKGLPPGLKVNAATGVVSGTPTKPGEYEVTFSATSSMNSKSKDTVEVKVKVDNYVDDLIPVEDHYGPYTPGKPYVVTISEAAGCTVSGLPPGMKWTAKDIRAKGGMVTTPSNSVYGIPTKPGPYTVYFRKSISERNDKGQSVKVTHTATATFEVSDYPTISLLPSLAIAGSEPMAVADGAGLTFFIGVKQSIAVGLARTLDGVDTTVAAKGLPPGLKLARKTVYVDPTAKKKVVDHYEYAIEGVPTKASSVNKKTVVPSHVALTASNKYKWSGAHAFDITVLALPKWAQGTFAGGGGNGVVSLTVSPSGKVSGKWRSEGKDWTLSAASYSAYYPDEEKFVAAVIGKSGKLVMTNEIEVTESGMVAYDARGGDAASTTWEAWRNGWREDPLMTLATELKGRKISVSAPVAEDRDGTVTLTVGAGGVVTAKGTFVIGFDAKKQRDTTYSASCSTVLIPREPGIFDVYLYFPPKSGKFDGFISCASVMLSAP